MVFGRRLLGGVMRVRAGLLVGTGAPRIDRGVATTTTTTVMILTPMIGDGARSYDCDEMNLAIVKSSISLH